MMNAKNVMRIAKHVKQINAQAVLMAIYFLTLTANQFIPAMIFARLAQELEMINVKAAMIIFNFKTRSVFVILQKDITFKINRVSNVIRLVRLAMEAPVVNAQFTKRSKKSQIIPVKKHL
ncbi:transmembrane protein, putative (macronuclear) [Tetrahymena thermophila SB210]|uniref:Transmembrane protein, putative n=1 Tax=Tetrahymena thermophila (strain SB210) TaxID=312017 RepID=W7XE95_TETTS|nr:transmembrane protein, putative [Tetrahymena thermophila SB210]EWS71194.1 transmembrane protein, putative [Tetrahymena thermophila SB210]|eukprot:XP_012656292.1 transmembrane protein, putative [Tetrahymena thermophila SB210]